MLEIRDLRHAYDGRTVLSVPSWDVAAGEASLVLGPSGSGKSTLLNVIAGLATPTEGSVRVGDEEVTRLAPAARDAFRARRVGLVLQTLHLVGVVSVRDNLRLAQRLAGCRVDDGRIDEVLAGLGIAALAGARASRLSVGEAQRVAIARAVVNRPALLLADEPTSALDDANCARALSLLLGQATACGATLLVATHDNRIRDRFARRLEL
ncbi:MAG TPA: ATP-binding cassette domain-containing protein [Usitatibacteraceae bacterium]|jgi:putative ABC transport system ATP-binding protein|nr:ATP-binding cassette domain-containing protein [Usitatibacteraceae bacterium]HQY46169.1 ATP-binding cassette domain-containing protein [Usitatibacteraceae bacterium]HRA22362.1 ATP-binding cassette domain-containing protein [Usitatibacteraceae bacterium]